MIGKEDNMPLPATELQISCVDDIRNIPGIDISALTNTELKVLRFVMHGIISGTNQFVAEINTSARGSERYERNMMDLFYYISGCIHACRDIAKIIDDSGVVVNL